MTDVGIRRKLRKAFLLQAVLISVVAVLGVFAAGAIMEEVLVRRALRAEADYFWQKRKQDAGFPLPDTLHLNAFLVPSEDSGSAPEVLRPLGPGFHELDAGDNYAVAYITVVDGQRLSLVLDRENVNQLAFYFGIAPLAGVLVVLYLVAWFAYRQTRRAVSPIMWLARAVHELDPERPDTASFDVSNFSGDPYQEVTVLADALSRFAQRINDFVERERTFTRDASHELRSPLTVIKIAADMLLSEQELGPSARKSVLRIQRSVKDMEDLVEAFLLLARESEQGLSQDPVSINQLVREEIARSSVLLKGKPIEVSSTADVSLSTVASEKVLSVLIGNLIRNAFSYTDEGRVHIHVGNGYLVIEDSGVGIPEQDMERVFKPFFRGGARRRGGYGVGLTIVKQLSDRFHWPVHIESKPEVGTKVTVRFPHSRSEPIAVAAG